MDKKEYSRLSLAEYDLIGKALFELLAECPELPEGVPLKYQMKEKGESISFLTFGSREIKKYVSGGFVAQVDFQIAYKSFPTSNGLRMEAQALVDKIMQWLEGLKDYPLLTNGRKITEIKASNSMPYTDSADKDGNVVFAADAIMEYQKKGDLNG